MQGTAPRLRRRFHLRNHSRRAWRSRTGWLLIHSLHDFAGLSVATGIACCAHCLPRHFDGLQHRVDHFAKLDAFQARIPGVVANRLRLDQLDLRAARAAIVGPLDRYNVLVTPEDAMLIETALVDAVLEQTAAALPVKRVGTGEDVARQIGVRTEEARRTLLAAVASASEARNRAHRLEVELEQDAYQHSRLTAEKQRLEAVLAQATRGEAEAAARGSSAAATAAAIGG